MTVKSFIREKPASIRALRPRKILGSYYITIPRTKCTYQPFRTLYDFLAFASNPTGDWNPKAVESRPWFLDSKMGSTLEQYHLSILKKVDLLDPVAAIRLLIAYSAVLPTLYEFVKNRNSSHDTQFGLAELNAKTQSLNLMRTTTTRLVRVLKKKAVHFPTLDSSVQITTCFVDNEAANELAKATNYPQSICRRCIISCWQCCKCNVFTVRPFPTIRIATLRILNFVFFI